MSLRDNIVGGVTVAVILGVGGIAYNSATSGGLITLLGGVTSAEFDAYKEADAQRWPNGTYAILKAGKCPVGWESEYGYMRGIQLPGISNDHLKQSTFGESSIVPHDGGNSGPFGQLHLVTCRKVN